MNAGEARLRKILEGTTQFVVPLFQRTYSWKPKNWKTLWEDICILYEAEAEHTHFIGSIVTSNIPTRPEEVSKHLLIDGQQRLTTIMILLAVIRDLDSSEDKRLSQEIRENYLTNRFHEDYDHLKLLPTQIDRDDFLSIIKGTPRIYHYGLLGAYKFFRQEIQKKLADAEENYDLRALCSRIVNSLNAVTIMLDKEDNPYLIFESLNFKGAPLTPSDLIRNYVFMSIKCPKEQQKAYDNHWLPMQKRLKDETILTGFMRHMVMQTGVMVRRDDTYLKLQRFLGRSGAGSSIDELTRANESSELYLRIIDPSKEPNPKLALRFKTIHSLAVTTSYPLILKLYNYYVTHKLNEIDFLRCLDAIASFMIRRAFCLYSTRPLARIFVNICRDVNEDNIVCSILQLLDKEGWPDDAKFKNGFLTTPIYRFDRDKTRFVLECLEESYGHKEAASLRNVTIEHVFPQIPHNDWKERLGNDAYDKTYGAKDQIGNLTLSAYNPEMSNKWFGDKKRIYADSNLDLNCYFKTLETWCLDTIVTRAEDLFEKAQIIWQKPTFEQ